MCTPFPPEGGTPCVQVGAEPKLELLQNANTTLTLSWSGADRGFALETSTTLGLSAVWQPVSTQTVLVDGRLTVSLPAGDLTRYFRLRGVIATVLQTSPALGESGVAITRETIFRFSDPLSPDLTLTGDELFAEFGARRLLSRAELSSDRKTATLFYLENLPASARIRVTLDGSDLLDSSSRSIDADGDGQAGGMRVLELNTAGITGLANTAVILILNTSSTTCRARGF